jgi:hypothetical protein
MLVLIREIRGSCSTSTNQCAYLRQELLIGEMPHSNGILRAARATGATAFTRSGGYPRGSSTFGIFHLYGVKLADHFA